MHHTQQSLLEYLERISVTYTLYKHEPLRTCAQALKAIEKHNIPGTGIKNLFLKDSNKNLYLIIALYNTKIDLKKVGKTINAKELRFASPELLQQYLAVEAGAVTPLALINDTQHHVQPIVDTLVFGQQKIQVHPLRNDATVVITPHNLIAFLRATEKKYVTYDFSTHSANR